MAEDLKILYDKDGSLAPLDGKTVAVMGFGSTRPKMRVDDDQGTIGRDSLRALDRRVDFRLMTGSDVTADSCRS